MRTILIILLFIISISSYSQEKANISLKAKDTSIRNIIKQIENTTEYSFVYNETIDLERKRNINIENKNIDDVLKILFRDTEIGWTINKKHIILKNVENKKNKQTFKVRIIDKTTEEPIEGVNVSSNNKYLGITDEQGYYTSDLSEDLESIFFSRIGYERIMIELKSITTDRILTIYLNPKTKHLEEVIVTSDKMNQLYSPQMGSLSMTQKEIKTIPTAFGEADIIKALQIQPGVSSGVEGLAGMYVRGGNNDENLLMIDGNPLYQVNHLGGLFSSFNVEAIDNVDFYKSAFPAKYGGRLSSVMDVQTKSGSKERYHGAFSLGLTSGNINIGGPIVKDKTSFNFSVRRSWLELLTTPALAIINSKDKEKGKETTGRYAFTDLNLKLDHTFNPRSHLYFILYYGNDYLKIGEREFSTNKEDDPFEKKDVNRLKWGNLLTALGWKYKLSNKLKLETVASYTYYNSNLQESSYIYWGEEGNSENDNMDRIRENNINDISLRTSFYYLPTDNHSVSFGINYMHHKYVPEKIYEQISQETTSSPVQVNNPVNANEVSLFLEDDWRITKQVRVNAGLRINTFAIPDKTYLSLDPRISTRVMLSDVLSLKASYAHMTQFAQQVSDSHISLPTDFWMPINKNFKPLGSDQVSLGLYYNFKDKYSLSVEGYHKWMKNLLEYKDGYNLLPVNSSWDSKLTAGKGTAYGADLLIEKKTGKFKGSIGYGLMWTDRYFENINRGRHFPSKYDNRHKVNITGNYTIKENMDINFSWTFMTGNRITLSLENYQDLSSSGFPPNIAPSYPYPDGWGIDYYDTKNNVRLPAYHRLDLGLNIYQPKKNGHLGIWNISIYNAYSYMNPIVINKDIQFEAAPTYAPYPQFRSLSILPIIPSVSYTYKF